METQNVSLENLRNKLADIGSEVEAIAKIVEAPADSEPKAEAQQSQPEPEDDRIIDLRTLWTRVSYEVGGYRHEFQNQNKSLAIDGQPVYLVLSAEYTYHQGQRNRKNYNNPKWIKGYSEVDLASELDKVNGIDISFVRSDENEKLFIAELTEAEHKALLKIPAMLDEDGNVVIKNNGQVQKLLKWYPPRKEGQPQRMREGLTLPLEEWKASTAWMAKQKNNWGIDIQFVGFDEEDDGHPEASAIHALYEKNVIALCKEVNKKFKGQPTPSAELWAKTASYWFQCSTGVAYDTKAESKGDKDFQPDVRVIICLKYGLSGGLRDYYFYRPGQKPTEETVDRMNYEGGFYPEKMVIYPIQRELP